VLLIGLWGWRLLPVLLLQPGERRSRQVLLVVDVHLWVEGVWELILGSLLAFVLIKTPVSTVK
jgi:nitric oxide reductase subunit B